MNYFQMMTVDVSSLFSPKQICLPIHVYLYDVYIGLTFLCTVLG